MATIQTRCPLCQQHVVFPQKSLEDAEARHWRERYEELMAQLNDAVRRCHIKHGSDPMHQWFLSDLIEIRRKLGLGG